MTEHDARLHALTKTWHGSAVYKGFCLWCQFRDDIFLHKHLLEMISLW